MFDLRRADAEGQRPEGAVRGGVAVAAHHGHAGLGEALLGSDHVHDALADVVHAVERHAEVARVALERLDLVARQRIGDALAAVGRRHVVVGDGNGGVRPAHPAARRAQAFESLRAGDLEKEMTVDIEQHRAVVLLLDDVALPDLVVQRARPAHARPSRQPSMELPYHPLLTWYQ